MDPDRILVGGVNLCLSTDGGVHWTVMSGTLDTGTPVHDDFWAVRWTSPSDVYVGSDGGYYESHDGGLHWSATDNTLPNLHTVRIAAGPTIDRLMGSAWDVGTFVRGRGSWTTNDA
jgi:hypothetical protein